MVPWQDAVNGAFELLAGCAVLNHCRVLYHDKQIRGVSLISTLFFASWGTWNLYYYPWLNQWVSFVGGMFIFGANTVWVALMLRYRR